MAVAEIQIKKIEMRWDEMRWRKCRAEQWDTTLFCATNVRPFHTFSVGEPVLTAAEEDVHSFQCYHISGNFFFHILEFREFIQQHFGILSIFAGLREDFQTKINSFSILMVTVAWREGSYELCVAGVMRTASKFLCKGPLSILAIPNPNVKVP